MFLPMPLGFDLWLLNLEWLWLLSWLFSWVSDTYLGFLHHYRPSVFTEGRAYRQLALIQGVCHCASEACMQTHKNKFWKARKKVTEVFFCCGITARTNGLASSWKKYQDVLLRQCFRLCTQFIFYCFCCQDTNENYDLPVIREFNDIYYFTHEAGLTSREPTFDPFRQDPLPEIGQDNKSSRHSSLTGQQNGDNVESSRPQTHRGLTGHQSSNVFKKVKTINFSPSVLAL